MWWYPYWYLVKGRQTWDVIWVDPTAGIDPRAKLEEKLGRLDGFEPIEGAQPMHVKDVLNGATFVQEFPKRKRGDRRRKVEMVVAAQ